MDDPLVTSPEAGRNQRQAGEAKRMAWLTQGRTRSGSPGMHDRVRVCTPVACPHMIRAHGCGPSCPSVSSVSRPVSRHALTRHYDHRRPDARSGNMFWIGVRYIWALTSCLRPKSSACRACMMDYARVSEAPGLASLPSRQPSSKIRLHRRTTRTPGICHKNCSTARQPAPARHGAMPHHNVPVIHAPKRPRRMSSRVRGGSCRSSGRTARKHLRRARSGASCAASGRSS